jgi:hypothetical protein
MKYMPLKITTRMPPCQEHRVLHPVVWQEYLLDPQCRMELKSLKQVRPQQLLQRMGAHGHKLPPSPSAEDPAGLAAPTKISECFFSLPQISISTMLKLNYIS